MKYEVYSTLIMRNHINFSISFLRFAMKQNKLFLKLKDFNIWRFLGNF